MTTLRAADGSPTVAKVGGGELALVGQLSRHLASLAANDLDAGILAALESLGEFTGARRCLVFESSGDGSISQCTHSWSGPGLEPLVSACKVVRSADHPRLVAELDLGNSFNARSPAEPGDSAEAEQRWFAALGPGSVLALPLVLDGKRAGMVVLLLPEGHLPHGVEDLAQLVGDMVLTVVERRRAERRLASSELNLSTLFESLDDFLFILDSAGRILHSNALVSRRLGFSQDDLRRLTAAELFGLHRVPGGRELMTKLLEGSAPTHLLSLEQRSGSAIAVEVKVNPGQWNGQRVLFATCRDVTERRQAAEGLRRSEARTNATLDAIPDTILRLRGDGTILDFVPGDLPSSLGLDEDQGKAFARQLAACCQRGVHKAIASSDIQVETVVITAGTEEVTFEARVRAMGEDEVLAIIRDVSRQARLDQMKSDFINRASHELRTPLTTALLMVELIREGGEDEEIREFWDILELELKRQHALVEDLLMAGRLESGRLQVHLTPLDLAEIVNRAVKELKQLADARRLNLACTIADDLPPVEGDSSALHRVFANLLDNAIKFTPAGGSVSVEVALAERGIQIRIADTGIGIPKEELSKLFDRFFRASNAVMAEIRGTGMGLFIVRSLMEAHGGTVTVASGIDQGTTFTLWLPLPTITPPLICPGTGQPSALVRGDQLDLGDG